MSEITRRDALSRLAASFAVAGAIDRLAASDLHAMVEQAKLGAPHSPTALNADQFRTLERLTDLIIPVDNGKPGALEAGVPGWIDTLLAVNADLKTRYVSGLAWLDAAMVSRGARSFAAASGAEQVALLDLIAYKKNASPERDPGIQFFTLVRRMTVDGFYTSPMGMRDIYQGNQARPDFVVPREAIDYVLSRSPLK